MTRSTIEKVFTNRFPPQKPLSRQIIDRLALRREVVGAPHLADAIEAVLFEVLVVEGHIARPDVERLPRVEPGQRVGRLQAAGGVAEVAVDPPRVVGGSLATGAQLLVERSHFAHLVELHQLGLAGRDLPGVADLEGGQDEDPVRGGPAPGDHRREPLVQIGGGHHVDVDDQDVGGLGASSGHIPEEVIRVGDVRAHGVVPVPVLVGFQPGEDGGAVVQAGKVPVVLFGEAGRLPRETHQVEVHQGLHAGAQGAKRVHQRRGQLDVLAVREDRHRQRVPPPLHEILQVVKVVHARVGDQREDVCGRLAREIALNQVLVHFFISI